MEIKYTNRGNRNRCIRCGRMIAYRYFENGDAVFVKGEDGTQTALCPKHAIESDNNPNPAWTPHQRYWGKVNVGLPDECWEWESTLIYSGYGMFWEDGKARMAHRIAYRLANGGDAKQEVMHSCDNRSCCNPNHLSDGSHKENMADARSKGRIARGERSTQAKLTNDIVRHIREMWDSGSTCAEIAETYEIDSGHAWRVANRKVWKHVD